MPLAIVVLLAGAIGPEPWKISGQFAGSYVGGGGNCAAVGEAVGTSDTLFALFLVVLVAVHGLVVFGVGRLLKIEIETLSVASQACVGGPSTSLALAVSKKQWRALVTPAVLIGVLGYAVGNHAGVGMASLLRAGTG